MNFRRQLLARKRQTAKLVGAFMVSAFLLFYIVCIYPLPPPPVADVRPSLAGWVHRPPRKRADGHGTGQALHGGIPRIIHQTWKNQTHIPDTFRQWMASWLRLNPDWEYWLWSDDDIRRFMAAAYPDYLQLYDEYPSQSYRIDVFRYFALYEYGGLYVDLDMECLRPVDDILDTTGCLLSQEPVEHAEFLAPVGVPLVSNALMACRRGHPFFAYVISGLRAARAAGPTSWNDVLWATGPYMLTVAYRGYSAAWRTLVWPSSSVDPVVVADADTFQPSPDDSMVDYMRGVCRRPLSARQSELCSRLAAYDFGRSRSRTAYTTHHWTHSWVGRRNDPWGLLNVLMNHFGIAELTRDVVGDSQGLSVS